MVILGFVLLCQWHVSEHIPLQYQVFGKCSMEIPCLCTTVQPCFCTAMAIPCYWMYTMAIPYFWAHTMTIPCFWTCTVLLSCFRLCKTAIPCFRTSTMFLYTCDDYIMFLDIYHCRAGRYEQKLYLCIFWLICGIRYISRYLYTFVFGLNK